MSVHYVNQSYCHHIFYMTKRNVDTRTPHFEHLIFKPWTLIGSWWGYAPFRIEFKISIQFRKLIWTEVAN